MTEPRRSTILAALAILGWGLLILCVLRGIPDEPQPWDKVLVEPDTTRSF